MAVNLSLFAGAGWQFFDNNGIPLAGGLLYTYAAGTTTPQATYTTNLGNVAQANPIVLDSSGRVTSGGEIWLNEGFAYKFVLETSLNVTLGTYDNIFGGNDATALNTFIANLANTSDITKGDALVGFRQSNASGNLTGAVGKTVHQKFQEMVSVKDFGAVGDGITDDTAAIQAAINAAAASVKTVSVSPISAGVTTRVHFPAGVYITGQINLSSAYLDIEGDRAILQGSNASNSWIFYQAASAWQIRIKGLQFCNAVGFIYLNSSNLDRGKVIIQDCDFYNSTNFAVSLYCQSSFATLLNCRWSSCVRTIYNGCDKLKVDGGWITEGVLTNNQDAGIHNYGVLEIYNILGVPVDQTTTEYAWINNYGTVRVLNMRFGGENGSHTMINNFTAASVTYPIVPNEVSMVECDLYCVNPIPHDAIRLFAVPNVIRVKDCNGMPDGNLLVGFSSTVTPSAILPPTSLCTVDVQGNGVFGINGAEPLIDTNLFSFFYYKTARPIVQELPKMTLANIQQATWDSATNGSFIVDPIKTYTFGSFALTTFLIEFTSNPNIGGSGSYQGKYVGLLNITGIGFGSVNVYYQATMSDLFNSAGGPPPGPAPYTVSVTWVATGATGAAGLLVASPDTRIQISFDNCSNNQNYYRIVEPGKANYLY